MAGAEAPRQEALRPGAQTAWSNVYLAGDWTDTGLPPTIESAIRSGEPAQAEAMYEELVDLMFRGAR